MLCLSNGQNVRYQAKSFNRVSWRWIDTAKNFQQIGWFYTDNRRTNAKLYVVCARGTFRDNYSLQPDETEFISSDWLEINKLEQMISNGQIVNYSMLAAWALFKTAPMK